IRKVTTMPDFDPTAEPAPESRSPQSGTISIFCPGCRRATSHKHFVFQGDKYACRACGCVARLDQGRAELFVQTAAEFSAECEAARAQGAWPEVTTDDADEEEEYDYEAEARARAAWERLAELPKLYRAGTVSREQLVHDALAAGPHFDVITRSSLYDIVEFKA